MLEGLKKLLQDSSRTQDSGSQFPSLSDPEAQPSPSSPGIQKPRLLAPPLLGSRSPDLLSKCQHWDPIPISDSLSSLPCPCPQGLPSGAW